MDLEPYVDSELVKKRNAEIVLECKREKLQISEAMVILVTAIVFAVRFSCAKVGISDSIKIWLFFELVGFGVYLADLIKVCKVLDERKKDGLVASWIFVKPLYLNIRGSMLQNKWAVTRSVVFGYIYFGAWMVYLLKLLEVFVGFAASCG